MSRMTVYVVDDCKDTSDSLAALLSAMGHDATACYSAEQVLARVAAGRPDCVMLDIAMAGMDGLGLVQQLRAEFGDDIVLVAVTGSPRDHPRVQATLQAVDHYFEKPVTLEQVRKLFPA